jgi:hypothetical protein
MRSTPLPFCRTPSPVRSGRMARPWTRCVPGLCPGHDRDSNFAGFGFSAVIFDWSGEWRGQ